MISATLLGIKNPVSRDRNGVPILGGEYIQLCKVINKKITISDFVDGVETRYEPNQTVIQFEMDGTTFRTIIGSSKIKDVLNQLKSKNVTKFETVIIQEHGRYYTIDLSQTDILEISNRPVTEQNGIIVYIDTGEVIE